MKKNIFIKLGGVLIGLALSLGVSVGVTARNKVSEVKAADTKTLTFALTSNPGGWPTDNSTTLTNYTYTLSGTSYTFALSNVKCNSGYLMLTQPAVLGLPAIENYKLTKVVAKNSGDCSTSVNVGVSSSSSSASYISGGATQTWSTKSSTYTYNLSGTSNKTMYYLYVTTKNAQITELSLTYEGQAEDVDLTDISIPSTASVQVGSTTTLSPIKTPTNANKNDTLSWESLDPTYASVNQSGVVSGLKEGKARIRVNATDIGKSAICTVTVNPVPPVPVTHTIADCYSVSTGTSVKFNGVYMGTYGNNPYQGIFFADGEYGILIYGTSSVPGSWEVGKTVVAVSGKTAFYNGLVQVTNASFETTSAIVADPVPYTFLGTETTGDALSRKSSISGTVTSVIGQTNNAFVTGTDGKVTVDLGDDKTAMIFIKKGVYTAEELAEYSEKFTVGAYVVVTGFLNYFNNATTFKGTYTPGSFQIIVPSIVSTEVYDADAFALDFLNDTGAICSIVKDDHGTELVAVWPDIGAKFTALSDTEKAKVSAADSQEDSDLGRAVERYDYLVSKYGLTNFLGRSVLSSARYIAYNQNSSNTFTIIIIVASIVSLSTLAALMVIKRRKAIEK